MASHFSRYSPIPAFPEYTGPYKVGTMDVEIPVADLASPTPAPEGSADIPTVLYRIFYPAVPESDQKRISWLPNPQRQHVSAYTKFLGFSHTVAELLSFFPRHMYYTSIPVHKNATMQTPDTENKRWPTIIFSHGLGGSRNSYSYIAGSLASHGVVVICPEHREGSAVVSFMRATNENGSTTRRSVPYLRISHDITPEMYLAREAQLRIRLWEMGLVHEAVLAMDTGSKFKNLNQSTPSLKQFVGQLHVHEPGSIIFAGHSFGAATVYQMMKSTYYAESPELAAMEKPLFTPAKDSNIRRQVTERTVTMLLDMWVLPLTAPNSEPLFNLPLPIYADVPTAPGGSALLAVESEAFHNWKSHINVTARVLSPDPSAKVVTSALFERPNGTKVVEPNFFYVVNSAHLSQSDFGILFPWLTKKIFSAEQPERALRLNLRAQLQILRANGIPVARTHASDLVDGIDSDNKGPSSTDITDDKAIFDRSVNSPVEYWKWINLVGLGQSDEEEEGKTTTAQVEETEKEMMGEYELGDQSPLPAVRRMSAAAA